MDTSKWLWTNSVSSFVWDYMEDLKVLTLQDHDAKRNIAGDKLLQLSTNNMLKL